MTNSEKYLKDEQDLQDFIKDLALLIAKGHHDATTKMRVNFAEMVCEWLDKEAKPTLTEDERAFLSLLPFMFEKVGKDKLGCLYITYHKEDDRYQYSLMPFNHLFQFIKERRRILY